MPLEAAEACHGGGEVCVVWNDTYLLEKYDLVFFCSHRNPYSG
jgi:hypothetical protein